MKIVLDTDVVVAGVISPSGASRLWLKAILNRKVAAVVSVPLALQYEAVLKRPEIRARSGLTLRDIDDLLDGLFRSTELVRIAYLWRPSLPDPADEMVLEAAVNGGAEWLLTFNQRDLGEGKRWGLEVAQPGAAWRQFMGISDGTK